MKVLWITNIIFPDVSKKLGLDTPVVGAWMYVLASDLLKRGISLVVVTARKKLPNWSITINGIDYYTIRSNKGITMIDDHLIEKWKKIIDETKPDLVHIHGTEYAYGLALMQSCPKLRYVISIQGLLGPIAENYTGGLDSATMFRNITIRDIIKGDTVFSRSKNYLKWSNSIEDKYLLLATDVIGRTGFDHDYVLKKNKAINYHFCNESLRDGFYSSRKWNIDNKIEYRIFMSQAVNPLKGLHNVLMAVDRLQHKYENIKIHIGGRDILKASHGIKNRLKRTGYGSYIASLLNKFHLNEKVKFLGLLDEEQMINEYLNCHVFICPSSIENSPNSLGEAQILGVPTIASEVGGIPDMVEHGRTGLLCCFGDVTGLSNNIELLFTDDDLVKNISKLSQMVAGKRHDRLVNTQKTLDIYEDVLK